VNVVILCGCGPINTCLINLIAEKHPVRHAFRVVWTDYEQTKSRWSKIAHSPIRTVNGAVRRRFYNWLDGRIESRAADYLIARGVSANCNVPFSTIDRLKINTSEFAQSLRALETDILLTSACPLLQPEIFEIPNLATINIHRGIAPKYRGQRTIFWPLYFNDFDHIGITLHVIDHGIDTGPILAHGFPELQPQDSEATILAKNLEMAAEILGKLLGGSETGNLQGVRQ
jgi:methionyl-tRNA formyltransferase